jgi:hypothetical protein
MNTKMDAEQNDDPADATEEPTTADAESVEDDSEEFAHLDSLSDGAGCTEIWEHLSETRDEE